MELPKSVIKTMPSSLVFAAVGLLLCFNGALTAEPVDWWEGGTFYQIYPRSFKDSNGDGIGDLNGITSHLRYLKELGVTATWISPIFESPMADMGYDITNFTNIDPLFGNLDDFDALIKQAKKLGVKIILDFVPNHSSDQHVFFQKSVRREPGYEDFYVWADGKIDEKTGERVPPSNWLSIFIGPMWTWNEQRQQYFLHQFLPEQPDFNMTNPKVRQHLIDILEFWLDRGVDGFRIDAVPHFVERRFDNGTYPDNPPEGFNYTQFLPETRELLYEWRAFLDQYKQRKGGDTRILLGESYSSIEFISDCISNGTHAGIQMPMNLVFLKMYSELAANATFAESLANYWMTEIWPKHGTANWLTSNHDVFRIASRVGQNRVDIMTMIIHALPGASITYNGEEIGMSNIPAEEDRINKRKMGRSPMQWDSTKFSGFTTGNSTWLQVNNNYKIINVQMQERQNRSHLKILKEMIKLKKTAAFKAFKEVGGFAYKAVTPQVFQVVRTDHATEEYRVLANFGSQIEYIEGLTNKVMEYVILNSYSPHQKLEKIDLSKPFYLMPFEAIVLRGTV